MKKTKEEKLAYLRKYHQEHKEEQNAKRRAHYKRHIEKVKEYKKNNKEKIRTNTRNKAIEKKLTVIELLGGCCSVCRNKFPPYIYDLHHIDPKTKDYPPASLYSRSWEIVFEEIKKCVLVCANCHRKIHHEDKYDILREDFEDDEEE